MSGLSRFNYDDAAAAAAYIGARIKPRPQAAVLTGTGLGEIGGRLKAETVVNYREIPHFPTATVPSHYGRMVYIRINGRPLLVLQGRFHLYEGYSPLEVTFPIRVLQALGVRYLILTNAAGGINPGLAAGDIMIIKDHINLTGVNPLVGPNDERWGPRFVSMVHAYDSRLQSLAQTAPHASQFRIQSGVYAGLTGPSLETRAEMHFLRTVGADAVGFSTIMEAIAGVHAGMQVAGLSVITNMCLPDESTIPKVDDIIAVAQSAAPHLENIITHMIQRLDEENQ